MTSSAILFQRAEGKVAATVAARRQQFERDASGIAARFANVRQYNSGAVVVHMHERCARELSERSALIVASLLESHRAMRASVTNRTVRDCKDWIAARIAEHADEIARPLVRLPAAAAARERGTLVADAASQIKTANALIDEHFDQIRGDKVRRAARWAVRLVNRIRTLISV